jgi:hypothetical protein
MSKGNDRLAVNQWRRQRGSCCCSQADDLSHPSQADKLLSPEFQPVIEQLIAHVKPDRQIMLYSATFPVTVKQFKDKFLNKPYIVNLMEELTLKGITQVLHFLVTCTFVSALFVFHLELFCCRIHC